MGKKKTHSVILIMSLTECRLSLIIWVPTPLPNISKEMERALYMFIQQRKKGSRSYRTGAGAKERDQELKTSLDKIRSERYMRRDLNLRPSHDDTAIAKEQLWQTRFN